MIAVDVHANRVTGVAVYDEPGCGLPAPRPDLPILLNKVVGQQAFCDVGNRGGRQTGQVRQFNPSGRSPDTDGVECNALVMVSRPLKVRS